MYTIAQRIEYLQEQSPYLYRSEDRVFLKFLNYAFSYLFIALVIVYFFFVMKDLLTGPPYSKIYIMASSLLFFYNEPILGLIYKAHVQRIYLFKYDTTFEVDSLPSFFYKMNMVIKWIAFSSFLIIFIPRMGEFRLNPAFVQYYLIFVIALFVLLTISIIGIYLDCKKVEKNIVDHFSLSTN